MVDEQHIRELAERHTFEHSGSGNSERPSHSVGLHSSWVERRLRAMKAFRAGLLTMILLVILPSGAWSQLPATPPPEPKFEVASVKPNKSASEAISGRGFGRGRWDRTNAPLEVLIIEAFGIRAEQLVGLPGWAKSERFDVDARTDAITDMTRLNQSEVLAMMQALLRERFSLISHAETRDVPTYDVVLARSDGGLGRDLHQTEHSCSAMTAAQRAEAVRNVAPGAMFCGWQIRPNEGRSAGDGQRLDMLLTQFPFILGRPVMNKTA